MVYVMSRDRRSALMSRIRERDTGPELRIRHYLWRAGFRYQLYRKDLPGRPDLVLPKWHAVVFVHGCFWHRHAGCPYFRLPKTRTGFWNDKLQRNHERDVSTIASLLRNGWRVAIVWECATRKDADMAGRKLAVWIKHGKGNIEVEGDRKAVRAAKLAIGNCMRAR